MAVTGAHTTTERVLGLKEESKELFPGILNEVTLNLITPKLRWRDLNILSSTSRCWQDAIRTKEVYDTRVRANTTETLIVHIHVSKLERMICGPHSTNPERAREKIALYSTSENLCYELPEIPWLHKRPDLLSCRYITLDGKLYVLGGQCIEGDGGDSCRDFNLAEVYMLDLAGQRQWERCTSMREPRSMFLCGVMGGKIYVFGGTEVIHGEDGSKSLPGCEVYDPQKRDWSPIMSITKVQWSNEVATIGKEIFIYCGRSKETLEVYNPAKNNWRVIERFPGQKLISIPGWPLNFVAKEKFWLLYESGIDVYDPEQNSWINLHTNSFAAIQPNTKSVSMIPITAFAVKDELFLIVCWRGRARGKKRKPNVEELLRCKGFDTEKKLIVWQKANCSSGILLFGLNCSIEL